MSIVTPFSESELTIERCIDSVLSQERLDLVGEWIFVSDQCQDASIDAINALRDVAPFEVRVLETDRRLGPGGARNLALESLSTTFFACLDSDDYWAPGALQGVADALTDMPDVDVVAMDWLPVEAQSLGEHRRDRGHFQSRASLLNAYVRNWVDQSPISYIYRTEILRRGDIWFRSGIYEDIDFLFRFFSFAEVFNYAPRLLVLKDTRPTSITGSIGEHQIDAYLRAWREIALLIDDDWHGTGEWQGSLPAGVESGIASRIHQIVQKERDPGRATELLMHLWNEADSLGLIQIAQTSDSNKTLVYPRLFEILARAIELNRTVLRDADLQVLKEITRKSWSCRDLQTSIFLAPNEIRTCCQRFFVDGQMKGDVVLDVPVAPGEPVSMARVHEAKSDLIRAINTGDPSACDGCPFMEFREWPAVRNEEIQYMSMEQHSVCNLRCTYCDETYFGGQTVGYDAQRSIETWAAEGWLSHRIQIVWGGGEPVLDRNFGRYLESIDTYCAEPAHRFLSNSRIYSEEIFEYLEEGRGTLTTSIDAGNEQAFINIRGRSGFERTFSNLERYARVNPHLITIKYILTTGNMDRANLVEFVDACEDHHLLGCSFQISIDFKFEEISWSEFSSILLLYGELYERGASFIFLDDLIYNRWDWSAYSVEMIQGVAGERGFLGNLAPPNEGILWGTGFQAERIAKSLHLPLDEVFVVATSGGNNGENSRFHGVPIVSPVEAIGLGQDIVIAAVQAVPKIRQQLQQLGVDPSRIYRKLIL